LVGDNGRGGGGFTYDYSCTVHTIISECHYSVPTCRLLVEYITLLSEAYPSAARACKFF
jgi:hypothetical protein